MIDGRARHMGLGPLHTVSLAEARTRARQARQLILDGKDPIEVKYEARDARRSPGAMVFKEAAQRFIEVHDPTWRSARHRQQWRNTLFRDHASSLANRPISAIDGALITSTLAPIWSRTPETAKRVKQRIERVVAMGSRWHARAERHSSSGSHHEAMPFAELPAFMRELRGINSISARALEFTILTGARTSEVLKATWDEIDTKAKVWTIPAERMKANKLHRVPLSDRAMRILNGLPRDGSLVFPGSRVGRPLAADSLLKLLQRLRPGLTVHGLRSSFRDWAGDRTAYPRDVIEMALGPRYQGQIRSRLQTRRRAGEAPAPDGRVGSLLSVTPATRQMWWRCMARRADLMAIKRRAAARSTTAIREHLRK